MITLDQLKKIVPYAGQRAGVFLVPLNEAMDEFGIDTPARKAAFVAQLAHESWSFRYVSEIASGLAYNGRKDLGNTRPEAIRIAAEHGSTPGPWWKGHGLIQITGYDNQAGQPSWPLVCFHSRTISQYCSAWRSASSKSDWPTAPIAMTMPMRARMTW